jgi:tetratricopeptide (TPR) repeat protein
MVKSKKPYIALVIFSFLLGLCYIKMPQKNVYPALFSKSFPLSTPVSFWASTLGMRRLASDITWIQALQYYGSRESGKPSELQFSKDKDYGNKYADLKYYWQQIIRFDPLFVNVHLIGATTLAWNLKRYDEALEFISEGINMTESLSQSFKDIKLLETDDTHTLIVGNRSYFENFRWKLHILKAVIVFLHQDKFEKAIPLIEKIGLRKDAPDEIKIMLAQIYDERKDYGKALRVWLDVYDNTSVENRKVRAENHIQRLYALISSGQSGLKETP